MCKIILLFLNYLFDFFFFLIVFGLFHHFDSFHHLYHSSFRYHKSSFYHIFLIIRKNQFLIFIISPQQTTDHKKEMIFKTGTLRGYILSLYFYFVHLSVFININLEINCKSKLNWRRKNKLTIPRVANEIRKVL